MDSTVSTFHPFPFLPYELRREIYILATPPRIVHVKESWENGDHDTFYQAWCDDRELDYGDFIISYALQKFQEKYQDGLLNARLHPDLAYFAHNWRELIPFEPDLTQTCLESYGFTSTAGPHQPWLPTEETPEIPLSWLEDHLDVAFELLRESRLYSEAPIPPLLHTCADSRKILIDYGYRIAFGTRTSGPRTWFHFDRDRLFIAKRQQWHPNEFFITPFPDLLSGGPWDIGQFDPKDLRQVKQLVLGRLGPYPNDETITEKIGNLIPLIPNIREIFLEEWNDLAEYFYDLDLKYLSKPQNNPNNRTSVTHRTRELWRCVAVDEIDPLSQIFCHNGHITLHPGRMLSLDAAFFEFALYKCAGLQNGSFFEHLARQLEIKLALLENGPDTHRTTPKIKFVHVCSETTARRFVHERLSFWHDYMELRKTYARCKPSKSLMIEGFTQSSAFRINWPVDYYWPYFIQALEWDASQLADPIRNGDGISDAHLQGWFLNTGWAVEPSLEII
ncbi:hypothetical protein F4819DRAFT_388291 [Hypoxylon fuscum]|nr:hypothetical protein F4819DRAFT_388291 [Hypoxylon fuscum]